MPPAVKALRDQLYSHLFQDILPFWQRNAIDSTGGICSCIGDDGVILNRDKWLWSQWRAVWVFSRLYRRFGQQEAWLNIARSIADFCIRHGWDESQKRWRSAVDASGRELRGCDSVFTDGFAVYGLTELALASNRMEYGEWAGKTVSSILTYLPKPRCDLPQWPYSVQPGEKTQGIPMIFSMVLWEYAELTEDTMARSSALGLVKEIFDHFYRSDRDLILERVSQEGAELPAPRGTVILPGHGVENMWFQIHIARAANRRDRIPLCCHLIKRNLELGWDQEFGGLFLAVDANGKTEPDWAFADAKLWWPHTEALYASLLAYTETGDMDFLTWFHRILNYSLANYPVSGHGEWRQRLNRQGLPFSDTVALPVKDPFHLPRALLLCLELLETRVKHTSLK